MKLNCRPDLPCLARLHLGWMEKASPWILSKKKTKRTSGGSHQDLVSKLQVKGETKYAVMNL